MLQLKKLNRSNLQMLSWPNYFGHPLPEAVNGLKILKIIIVYQRSMVTLSGLACLAVYRFLGRLSTSFVVICGHVTYFNWSPFQKLSLLARSPLFSIYLSSCMSLIPIKRQKIKLNWITDSLVMEWCWSWYKWNNPDIDPDLYRYTDLFWGYEEHLHLCSWAHLIFIMVVGHEYRNVTCIMIEDLDRKC